MSCSLSQTRSIPDNFESTPCLCMIFAFFYKTMTWNSNAIAFTLFIPGVIFPSLLQLQRGITDVEERKQKDLCATKYKSKDPIGKGKLSEIDLEREEECPICMEMNNKVVLPNCYHSLCMKCYNDWHTRSQSCPFCRDSLKRVNSGDLWIYMSNREIHDLESINKENLKRLFMRIDKLPLISPDQILISYHQDFWFPFSEFWGSLNLHEHRWDTYDFTQQEEFK